MSATPSEAASYLDILPRENDEDAPQTTVINVVTAFPTHTSDPTNEQHMKLIEQSGTLDFWDRPEEDIYTLDDGEPA